MPNKQPDRAEGLLNLNKPAGLTSHDVVARVRRLTRLTRIGHAGTLDPPATGVLLLGLGKGTKLTQFLHEYPKTYRAVLALGSRTDTYDAAGKVIATRDVGRLSPEAVRGVLAGFEGTIEQIPPMYSALKWQGQRLYTLARQGIEIERRPRRVHIMRLILLDLSADTLTLEVECSGGTYVRVLADDIGQRLGCGAHLRHLTRTAVGPHTIAQALTLEALAEAVQRGTWHTYIIPLAQGLAGFPAITVTMSGAVALGYGASPMVAHVSQVEGVFGVGETVALHAPDGALMAVGTACVDAAEVGHLTPTTVVVRLSRVLIDPPDARSKRCLPT
jgi:tRNA pseudouridine55 synthase